MENRPIYVESEKKMENGVYIEVNSVFMFACVYLTSEEEADPETEAKLATLIQKYRSMKYKFVVMHSGKEDLLEVTKALLSHNKNIPNFTT